MDRTIRFSGTPIWLEMLEEEEGLPTCQVKASPRAFSDSSSLLDLGKEFRHNNNILGNNPLTTGTPAHQEISPLRLFI